MVVIRYNCPICSELLIVEVNAEKIRSAPTEPVPVVVTHGTPEHAITLFIDRQMNVRATSVSDILERIVAVERENYEKRFLPVPLSSRVRLDDLEATYVQILALVNGKRSIEEIAQIIDLPVMRVKIICERLVRMKRLDSVRVVIEGR